MPKNSVIFTCWLIVDSCSRGIIFGNGGSGFCCIGGMVNTGSSDMDSMSDCATDDCEDKESDDVARDNMAIINGVTVSAWEHAAKHPLKRGCAFHASVKVDFCQGWLVM